MSASTLPEYGTPEYTKFQNDYIGSEPAKVSPRNINSADEMEDCMERLFLRQDFYREEIGKVCKILDSPNCPANKRPLQKALLVSWKALKHTMMKAQRVIKHNKSLLSIPTRIQHYKSLENFLTKEIERINQT
jgi:hypothetical protein